MAPGEYRRYVVLPPAHVLEFIDHHIFHPALPLERHIRVVLQYVVGEIIRSS